jgi:hypothetical protein
VILGPLDRAIGVAENAPARERRGDTHVLEKRGERRAFFQCAQQQKLAFLRQLVVRLEKDLRARAIDVVDALQVEDDIGSARRHGLDVCGEVLRGTEKDRALELEYGDARAVRGEELHVLRLACFARVHRIAPVRTPNHGLAHPEQEEKYRHRGSDDHGQHHVHRDSCDRDEHDHEQVEKHAPRARELALHQVCKDLQRPAVDELDCDRRQHAGNDDSRQVADERRKRDDCEEDQPCVNDQ